MFSTIPLCIVLLGYLTILSKNKKERLLMFIKLEAEKCKFIRGNFLIYVNIKLQVYSFLFQFFYKRLAFSVLLAFSFCNEMLKG